MQIRRKYIEKVAAIRAMFATGPHLPTANAWVKFSNDEVWVRIVTQVVVVGSALPKKKMRLSTIRKQIKWSEISRISNATAARKIWGVLRAVGARYTGQNCLSCKKTAAIMRNLAFLKSFPGGPRGFIAHVATLKGPSIEKIDFVVKRLSFIKNKGARDLLTTGFGLVKDHIALDTRVVGALKHLGMRIPEGYASNPKIYARVENDLLKKLCEPLNMTGAELDQLLFYNYADIKKRF